MRMKILFFGTACMLVISLLGGCAGRVVKTAWTPLTEQTIKIALMGNEESFNADPGFLPGIQMAVDEIKKTSNFTVSIITYDDEGYYDKGVGFANEIAADPTIAAVISVQDFEMIDTVASILDAAQKPLIVAGGCYDKTSANHYEYLITDFISANEMGKMLGAYAVQKGLKSVVSSHTDTQFEKDEIKGFQTAISTTGTQFVDMAVGPFTREEFDGIYERWDILNADGVYISVYSYTMGAELIKMLRVVNPEIVIMTDYSLNNAQTLAEYAGYLDKTVIIPLYPVTGSDKLTTFNIAFESKNGFQATPLAAQAYDIIRMLAEPILIGVSDSRALMEKLKAEDGYAGVSGHINFDSAGRLIVGENQYLICEGGKFSVLQN